MEPGSFPKFGPFYCLIFFMSLNKFLLTIGLVCLTFWIVFNPNTIIFVVPNSPGNADFSV